MQPALTQRKDDVLPQFVQPFASSNGPIAPVADRGELRVHAIDVSEAADGLPMRGVGIHPAIDELLRPQIDVMRELVADFDLNRNAPEQRA